MCSSETLAAAWWMSKQKEAGAYGARFPVGTGRHRRMAQVFPYDRPVIYDVVLG
jgi:hypothetical protein